MTPGNADFWLGITDMWSLVCILAPVLLALAVRSPALLREFTNYRVRMSEQRRLARASDALLARAERDEKRIEQLGELHLAALGGLVGDWRRQPELAFDALSNLGGEADVAPATGRRRAA